MNYSKSKSTKRFTFGVSRNDTSHKAGSNVLTIETNPIGAEYSVPASTLTLTVREASALQGFLNETLSDEEISA